MTALPLRPKSAHAYREAVLSEHGPKGAAARLVAVAAAQMMDRTSLETYAGADAIAKRCGLSERAVRTNLTNLVRAGWLKERTKLRGRDYWQKIRQASIPHGLPEAGAGSQLGDSLKQVQAVTPATPCSSDTLKQLPDSLQIDARVPADDDMAACKSLHGLPEGGAGNLFQRSPIRDLLGDLGAPEASPQPANGAGSAGARKQIDSEHLEAIRHLYGVGYPPDEIWEKHLKRQGLTLAQVQAVTGDLDRRRSAK